MDRGPPFFLRAFAIIRKHDEIRGVEKNFEKIEKVIKDLQGLKNNRLKIIIHTVFSAYNQDSILNLYEYFREKNIDQHRIGFLRNDSPNGEAKKIDIEKYSLILNKIKMERKGNVYSKIFATINKINNEINIRTIKENKWILPCVAGKKMIVINEEGDVYPCEILNRKLGNLRNYNYNIKELLKSYDAKSIRRFIVKKKCYCSWGCATQNNIIFNFRTYPKLFYRFFK